jgi:hypothetical protein
MDTQNPTTNTQNAAPVPAGPGARFQAWRALPLPSDSNSLATYRREIINIFEATDQIGVEMKADLLLTQRQLQTANDEITLLQEDIVSLRNDLARERATIYGLNQALAMLSPTEQQVDPRPKPQDLPPPPKYNGDRARLKAWKNSVNIKLTGDAAKFPDENHKLAHVYGLLEGKAMDQIQPYVLATGIDLPDIAALLAILDRAFGDPDPSGTATRALRALKQKADLSTYVAEFSRLAAEVPWNDRAKLDQFQEGLSHELLQALVHYPNPKSLEELIEKTSEIEQKLARVRMHSRAQSHLSSNSHVHHRAPPIAAPPPVPSGPPVNKPSHPSLVPGGATPMDLSSGRPRLTQAEKDRRRATGACIICGGTDHFMAVCPIRRNRPLAAHATTVSTADGTQEAESGKAVSLA